MRRSAESPLHHSEWSAGSVTRSGLVSKRQAAAHRAALQQLFGKSQRDFSNQPGVGRRSRPTLSGRSEWNTTLKGLKPMGGK